MRVKWLPHMVLFLSVALLVAGCGATPGPAAPEPTSGARGQEPYEIIDIGEDTSWDDEPLAYLESELVDPDPAGPELEAQVRWGYGLLYERYPDTAVLELTLNWQERIALILDTSVADWEKAASGRTSWDAFWQQLEKQALDLERGDLYSGDEVDGFLAGLSGAVAQAQPTARPTVLPTRRPAQPTARATTAPAVPLGRTYEDPAGFLTLDYPRGWTTHQSRSEMQFWADDSGEAALAVSIQIKAVSAAALVDEFSDLFAGAWDGYQELSRQETTIGDYPAVWVEQSYRQGGVAQRGLLVGVVRNRVGILLIAWAPASDYAELEPLFRASIASLRPAEFAEAPLYEQWETYASEHLVFHYLPGTWVARQIRSIAADHEEVHDDIVQYLGGTALDEPIDFYVYTTEESFYRSTARDAGFAINEHYEVHTRWFAPDDHQTLGHEMTHVLTYWLLGNPSEALLGEGIAVCLDHSGNDYQGQVSRLRRQGDLIPLAQMLGDTWGDYEYAYPVSGSFVCFLLEQYGVERFVELYPQADLPAALEELYGADLDALEQEWLDTLR